MIKKQLTLCIIYREDQVLLGMKKRGFGKGRWNGFGGKINQGESIFDAAKREVKEEIGVDVSDMKERGILEFTFKNGEYLVGHLFSASMFTGSPQETEEMRPEWFDSTEIPYDTMWPDDKYWLPVLLAGKNIKAKFHFQDNDVMLSHDVQEIPNVNL